MSWFALHLCMSPTSRPRWRTEVRWRCPFDFSTNGQYEHLVGGLEHFLFFHILGIIIPTDYYFSQGLKPPTRHCNDIVRRTSRFAPRIVASRAVGPSRERLLWSSWRLMGGGQACPTACFCRLRCYTIRMFLILSVFLFFFLGLSLSLPFSICVHFLSTNWHAHGAKCQERVPGGPQDRVGPSGPFGTSRILPGIQRTLGAKTVPWRPTFVIFVRISLRCLSGFQTFYQHGKFSLLFPDKFPLRSAHNCCADFLLQFLFRDFRSFNLTEEICLGRWHEMCLRHWGEAAWPGEGLGSNDGRVHWSVGSSEKPFGSWKGPRFGFQFQ